MTAALIDPDSDGLTTGALMDLSGLSRHAVRNMTHRMKIATPADDPLADVLALAASKHRTAATE